MKQIASVLGLFVFLGAALALTSALDVGSVVHTFSGGSRRGAGYNFDRRGQTAAAHADGEVAPETKHITVDNRFGNVKIAVADGGPKWSWDLKCWADKTEEAERFAAQIRMAVQTEGDRMIWTLELPPPPVPELRGVESNLTVMVPADVELELTNEFGETEIRGLQGGTLAQCRHGRLQLADLGTAVHAETSHADLFAERIAGAKLTNRHGRTEVTGVDGNLEIKTKFGRVTVRGVTGELQVENEHGKVVAGKISEAAEIRTSHSDVVLEEVGGNVRVRNRHGDVEARAVQGDVDVETQYGDIELDAACKEVRCQNERGRIRLRLTSTELRLVDAKTSHGDLSVELPSSLSPEIKARASSGEVKSDFPLHPRSTGSDAEDPDAITTRITLENRHRDIHIRKIREVAAP